MFFRRAQLAPNPPDSNHPGSGGGTPARTPAAHGHRPGGRLNLLLTDGGWPSERWAETLPRLLEPMGVSSLCARSAREAEKIIRNTDIHIAVVDLSLPLHDAPPADGHAEEGGPRILEILARLDAPPPTVVLKRHRSMRDQKAHLHAALRCGAFAVVDQTAANLETMLQVMQRCLTRFYDDRWPNLPSNQPPRGDPGPNFA